MLSRLILTLTPVSYLIYLSTIATNHRHYHPHKNNATINDWQFQSMSLSTLAILAGLSLRTWLLLTQIPALLLFYHGVFLAQPQYHRLAETHQHPPLTIFRNLAGAKKPEHQETLHRARQASWLFNALGLFGLPSAILTPTIVLIYRLVFPFHPFSLQQAFNDEYAHSPARDSTENTATFLFKCGGLGIFVWGFSWAISDCLHIMKLNPANSINLLLAYLATSSVFWLLHGLLYNIRHHKKTTFISVLFHAPATQIPEKALNLLLKIAKLPITIMVRLYLTTFHTFSYALHRLQFYRLSGWVSRHSTSLIAFGVYARILVQAVTQPTTGLGIVSSFVATLLLAKHASLLSPALTKKIETLETFNAYWVAWIHNHLRTRLLTIYQYYICAPLLANKQHTELGHTPVKGYKTKEALMNPVFVIEEDKDTNDKNYCPSIEQWYFIGILSLQYFFAVIHYFAKKTLSLVTKGKQCFYQAVLNILQPCTDMITHTTLCLAWSMQTCKQFGFVLLYPLTRLCTWLLACCKLIHNRSLCATTPCQDLFHSLCQVGQHAFGIPTALYQLACTGAKMLLATYQVTHTIVSWLATETFNTFYAILETPWHITKLACATWQPAKKNVVQSPPSQSMQTITPPKITKTPPASNTGPFLYKA